MSVVEWPRRRRFTASRSRPQKAKEAPEIYIKSGTPCGMARFQPFGHFNEAVHDDYYGRRAPMRLKADRGRGGQWGREGR